MLPITIMDCGSINIIIFIHAYDLFDKWYDIVITCPYYARRRMWQTLHNMLYLTYNNHLFIYLLLFAYELSTCPYDIIDCWIICIFCNCGGCLWVSVSYHYFNGFIWWIINAVIEYYMHIWCGWDNKWQFHITNVCSLGTPLY